MTHLLHIWGLLLFLPCTVIGADAFSLTVTNTKAANQRRYVTMDIRLRDKISVPKETTLLVVVGRAKAGGPADEFGPPQNFALKGTSHEIEPHLFRVEVALPLEKVNVKFMLADGKKVLHEQTRELQIAEQGATAPPAGQSDGSDNLSALVAADRAFPPAVAELLVDTSDALDDMSTAQKTLVGGTGVLVLAFVVFGVFTWVRVLQVIPYSSSCATTLVQISQQTAMVRPFFIGSFVLSVVAFEFTRRGLPRGLRFAYLITLGLGAALLVTPWIVDLAYR